MHSEKAKEFESWWINRLASVSECVNAVLQINRAGAAGLADDISTRSAGARQVRRVGKGSLTGSWKSRPGACPNIRGGITIERALPAGSKLWLTGWTTTIAGGEVVSILVEAADEGGRPRE